MSSHASHAATTGPAGIPLAGETETGERRSLRSQLLFLYGTGFGIGLHLASIHLVLSHSFRGFFYILAAAVVYTTVTFGLWKWVMPRFSSWAFHTRLAAQVLVSAAAFASLSFLVIEIYALLFGGSSLLRPYAGSDVTIVIAQEALRRAPLIYALMPIIPTAVLCVVGFNLHWWRILLLQARERELREVAASAQLAALRAQINPHFFFNSLNSIAQLIHAEPAKAEACVERLAEIFRYMLTRSQAEFVPVADELELAEAYLEIERARFGDELDVRAEIDDAARSVMVPGLILQPLVENAVKHGISKKIGGGSVYIGARVEQDALHLTVRDTGIGIRRRDAIFEQGVGLRSVRDRLVRLYGPAYEPDIETADGEGTTVRLRIPAAVPAPLLAGGMA
jgi:signal transduction histidine kinase